MLCHFAFYHIYITISSFTSVPPFVTSVHHIHHLFHVTNFYVAAQNASNKSYWYVLIVKSMHFGSPRDWCVHEARQRQTMYIMLLGKAKPNYKHWNSIQYFITSPVLVPSCWVWKNTSRCTFWQSNHLVVLHYHATSFRL